MKRQIWLLVGLMGLVLRGFGAPSSEEVENKQLFRESMREEMAARAGNLPASAEEFEQQRRFIFYAVLEGCYEDGVSTKDVSQILLLGGPRTNDYVHFVYACPVCMPTIHALEAYRSRPPQFYGMKRRGSTFGGGLAADVEKQLYSEKPEERLTAINALMQSWVSRRITLLRLSDPERAHLQSELEAMRKKGTDYLKNWESSGQYPGAAFTTVHQCAVCNGACGLNLKPDAGK